MSDNLPVLEPLKPVATCGRCERMVYAHSTSCNLEECPLRGAEWLRYLHHRGMQNMSPILPEEKKE